MGHVEHLARLLAVVGMAASATLIGITGSLLLSGCDNDDTFIEEILPPIPCLLPPGHCQMSDEEFDAMWDELSEDERVAYVDEWGTVEEQRTGFISPPPIEREEDDPEE